METRDLIIISSGRAVLSAASVDGRGNLSPFLIGGREIGGRMVLSESI